MKFYQIFFMIIALAFGSVLPAAAGEKGAAEPVAQAEAATPATVNINTATAEELAQAIKGVGAKKAQLIVQYREQYGEFATVDELAQVKGIGEGTIQANADILTVK
ncbi:MAG: ComEA family DNA-binding protein [Ketobacteraceae bacterium]|nr:ComEA family DNA-binding protein [Ketobacteraceae bacterium]